MTSWKRKRIVLVPGCMLCPAFQAVCEDRSTLWQEQVLKLLTEKQVGMVQMECPEVTFGGYAVGAVRKPHGIDYYEKLSGFEEHCVRMSEAAASQISELTQAGFKILAVLGVEHSPTCAVEYMYTRRGMIHRQGLYMGNLKQRIAERPELKEILLIGINRRYPDKAIQKLKYLCEQ